MPEAGLRFFDVGGPVLRSSRRTDGGRRRPPFQRRNPEPLSVGEPNFDFSCRRKVYVHVSELERRTNHDTHIAYRKAHGIVSC